MIPSPRDFARFGGELIRRRRDLPRFGVELIRQRRNPRYIISPSSYNLMRKLYVMSGGYLGEIFNRFVAGKGTPKSAFESGIKVLPSQDPLVLNQVTQMRCYVDQRPPGQRNVLADGWSPYTFGKIEDFDQVNIGTVRIWGEDLFANRPIVELIAADHWIDEVKKVLGTEPIAVDLRAWWSKPCSGNKETLSHAAQMWHRDLDGLRVIKIFVHVNDVEPDGGPFEYKVGSHLLSLHAATINDGRLDDAWVQARYPGRTKMMTGPAGTTFLVDTHGIHRGRPVKRGRRCVLQSLFSSSLFGAEFKNQPRIPLDPKWPSYPVWKAAIERNPAVWTPLFRQGITA